MKHSYIYTTMRIKFLAQGNNSSRKPWLGIEPGTLRLPGRCPSNPANVKYKCPSFFIAEQWWIYLQLYYKFTLTCVRVLICTSICTLYWHATKKSNCSILQHKHTGNIYTHLYTLRRVYYLKCLLIIHVIKHACWWPDYKRGARGLSAQPLVDWKL